LNPSFSIVTPSFNHGDYLPAALQSVLDQDYPHIEYFVADGGSTDNSPAILREFSSRPAYASRLRWISRPDRGQADAINSGFAATTGPILGWLNSDDTYAPGAFAAVAEIFSRRPEIGVVYGDAQFIDAAGNPIGPCRHIEPFNAHRLLHYSDFLVQPAAFFRREIFDKVGRLDPTLHWAMDYDLWLKFAKATQFTYLPKLLANYRWLGASKTASGGPERLNEVESVARRHGGAGLPAYFRLEWARMKLTEAAAAARRGRLDQTLFALRSGAAKVLASPRAVMSLFSPTTWKIIAMGQILRRHSAIPAQVAGVRKT
jgi:glycosyltransferase involved in cell wall biosynthesis